MKHNFDDDEMSSKQIGKHIKRQMRHEAEQKKSGAAGSAMFAIICLFAAYLMPVIGSYFVIAAVVFAFISWALSR